MTNDHRKTVTHQTVSNIYVYDQYVKLHVNVVIQVVLCVVTRSFPW